MENLLTELQRQALIWLNIPEWLVNLWFKPPGWLMFLWNNGSIVLIVLPMFIWAFWPSRDDSSDTPEQRLNFLFIVSLGVTAALYLITVFA